MSFFLFVDHATCVRHKIITYMMEHYINRLILFNIEAILIVGKSPKYGRPFFYNFFKLMEAKYDSLG